MNHTDGTLVDCFQWYTAKTKPAAHTAICTTRDVFQARLESLFKAAVQNGFSEDQVSLLVAVVGEIGNNSFDHNLGQWRDLAGCWLGYDLESRVLRVWVADRGNGVLHSLKRVSPAILNDTAALETAFTKVISGRAPEKRGNGLKFVRSVINGGKHHRLVCLSGTGNLAFGGLKTPVQEKALLSSIGTGVFTLVYWENSDEN